MFPGALHGHCRSAGFWRVASAAAEGERLLMSPPERFLWPMICAQHTEVRPVSAAAAAVVASASSLAHVRLLQLYQPTPLHAGRGFTPIVPTAGLCNG